MENHREMMKIGILALQGAFIEHELILRRLGVEAVEVRLPHQLKDLDGLIIPGGESTTIGKLAVDYGFMEPLRRFAEKKKLWGTCAGMIFMARAIIGMEQPLLGVMDIGVSRNAFGRQKESFETEIVIDGIADSDVKPFPAVFIRAPKIVSVRGDTRVIARLPDGTGVAARQKNLLVTSFHPELTNDDRLHRFFIGMIRN